MEVESEEDAPLPLRKPRGLHIKKRALKNKALAVSFDEKDLRDYVTGFHKRKKKRRKEAQKKQAEAQRRKRIEDRKKRKLQKELAYGKAPPNNGSGPDESDGDLEDDEGHEEEEDGESTALVTGTRTYDHGNMTVTVTTSEISHEDENHTGGRTQRAARSFGGDRKQHNLPMSKSFKEVAKHRARPKPRSKGDKKEGTKGNRKMN